MRRSQRLEEMEFELALVGALEDMYGVAVRVHGDPLNRGRKGYATLDFDYFCSEGEDPDAGEDVKVVVSIRGVPGASFSFTANFSEPDSVMRAASSVSTSPTRSTRSAAAGWVDSHPGTPLRSEPPLIRDKVDSMSRTPVGSHPEIAAYSAPSRSACSSASRP